MIWGYELRVLRKQRAVSWPGPCTFCNILQVGSPVGISACARRSQQNVPQSRTAGKSTSSYHLQGIASDLAVVPRAWPEIRSVDISIQAGRVSIVGRTGSAILG